MGHPRGTRYFPSAEELVVTSSHYTPPSLSCEGPNRKHAMYSDPQTITIATVAQVLNRTSSGDNAGAFKKDDRTVQLSSKHAYGNKRIRRTSRLDHSKVVPDPLFPAQNAPVSMSFYIVADVPETGYTVTEQKDVITGFVAWLTASSNANLIKLLNGES